ncbi:MAG: hypothetical protein EXS28_00085 [Pedosphaera sp.]|nr:hypothetical protein [Pedosphaera sp.]
MLAGRLAGTMSGQSKHKLSACGVALLVLLCLPLSARAQTVYSAYSQYNLITVEDRGSFRTLSFNGSQESRVSRHNGQLGHFEYTEYLQMPLMWAPRAKRVLMIGLGGGSTQKAFQHHYPDIHVDTVEIDPMVAAVAKKFFDVREAPKFKIHISDGRTYLKRHEGEKYDIILLDAYTTSRTGTHIPFHLATQEFFDLAASKLSAEGALGYNVIGTYDGWRADNVGALHRTLSAVFPHVYHFPAAETRNIVFVATRDRVALTVPGVIEKMAKLHELRPKLAPNFNTRIQAVRNQEPQTARQSPVLTDQLTPASGQLGSRSKD